MSPEEQRIAIAEACGWQFVRLSTYIDKRPVYRALMSELTTTELPDYLNDQNAMHEARKALTDEQAVKYRMNLMFLSDGPNAAFLTVEAALCDATAAQRAKEYLRAIGKWKESA